MTDKEETIDDLQKRMYEMEGAAFLGMVNEYGEESRRKFRQAKVDWFRKRIIMFTVTRIVKFFERYYDEKMRHGFVAAVMAELKKEDKHWVKFPSPDFEDRVLMKGSPPRNGIRSEHMKGLDLEIDMSTVPWEWVEKLLPDGEFYQLMKDPGEYSGASHILDRPFDFNMDRDKKIILQ